MKLYTAETMRSVDRTAIETMGIPSLRLMENAAEAVVCALLEEVPDRLEGRVAILCGKGNNGGDGMAVARLLKGKGYDPSVVFLSEPEKLSADASVQYRRLAAAGVRTTCAPGDEAPGMVAAALAGADLVVDAMLGTGLGGPLGGRYLEVVRAVNACGAFVASVDIPTGLSGDSLKPPGEAVRADLTLTLALAKPPLFTPEGARFCGSVRVLDIGIPAEAAAGASPVAEALDPGWAAPFFTARVPETHKGSAGRVLLVAGSRGKSGAAVLAARGALRAGAGLVTVATPESAQPVVAASLPEAMTLPLPETREGTLSMDALTPILDFCGSVGAVGMGPGGGSFPETLALFRELYAAIPLPSAVDADAVNAFDGRAGELASHKAPRVLTPHPGEMGRLVGMSPGEVQDARYDLAPEKAAAWDVALLLKGYRTLVAAPGAPWRINLSGGPHMAGPGFGDILTGVVTALLGRGLGAFDAASLAAWWHGAAADEAGDGLGGYGLLASEAADALPRVEGRLRARIRA